MYKHQQVCLPGGGERLGDVCRRQYPKERKPTLCFGLPIGLRSGRICRSFGRRFCRFGALVLHRLPEPRVFEGFQGGNPSVGVVDEDLLQQIEELLVEGRICRDDVLQRVGQSDEDKIGGGVLTGRLFIAATYFLLALVVSVLG